MRALGLSLLGLLCACGPTEEPTPSQSAAMATPACPSPPVVTYESFARPFMKAYCQRCHSKDATSAGIYGAPSDHHFDTAEQIRAWSQHIFLLSAGTSARIYRTMPLDAPLPTDEERLTLGQWLICGAP